MPMPRLTHQPSRMSSATRWAISTRLRGVTPDGASCWFISKLRRIAMGDVHDAVDKDTRRNDAFRINVAEFNAVLGLDDRQACGHGHDRIEIPAGAPVGEVAPPIRVPRL